MSLWAYCITSCLPHVRVFADPQPRQTHQQPEEEVSERNRAEEGKPAAHRDSGAIPSRPAHTGGLPESEQTGQNGFTASFLSLKFYLGPYVQTIKCANMQYQLQEAELEAAKLQEKAKELEGCLEATRSQLKEKDAQLEEQKRRERDLLTTITEYVHSSGLVIVFYLPKDRVCSLSDKHAQRNIVTVHNNLCVFFFIFVLISMQQRVQQGLEDGARLPSLDFEKLRAENNTLREEQQRLKKVCSQSALKTVGMYSFY